MAIVTDTLTLPKLAYLTACELAGVTTAPHPVFGSNQHYVTSDEFRAHARAQTWALLAEHGLARREAINPLFRGVLELLALPDREYYGWCASVIQDATAALIVAARDREAVRVLLDDVTMVIEPVDSRWLPDEFVSALPEVDGAVVAPTSVATSFYANPSERDPRRPLAEPPDATGVEYIRSLMTAPRDGIHQLYTAVRRDGERVRSTPLTAIDIASRGRILTYTNHDTEGQQYIHVVSGTAHTLITTLERTNQGL